MNPLKLISQALASPSESTVLVGDAMFYPAHCAKFPPTMVNGEKYNSNDFTCAIDSDRFEIGDVVSVAYTTANGHIRKVRCRVTDVPWHPAVTIGLSWRAYRTLESPSIKPISVVVEKVS